MHTSEGADHGEDPKLRTTGSFDIVRRAFSLVHNVVWAMSKRRATSARTQCVSSVERHDHVSTRGHLDALIVVVEAVDALPAHGLDLSHPGDPTKAPRDALFGFGPGNGEMERALICMPMEAAVDRSVEHCVVSRRRCGDARPSEPRECLDRRDV